MLRRAKSLCGVLLWGSAALIPGVGLLVLVWAVCHELANIRRERKNSTRPAASPRKPIFAGLRHQVAA